MQVVSRNEAKAAGLRHYFTGKPCKRGHVEPRFTHNKLCLGCHRDRATRRRTETPERIKALKAASYRRNKPKVVAAVACWQRAHPAARKATQAAYRARQRAAQQRDAAPHA